LERCLDGAAQFRAQPTGKPQPDSAALGAAQAKNRIKTKTPPAMPPVDAAKDGADADSGASRKRSVHLPISYPIETVPEITGIPRTKIFEAVRAKKLTVRKMGRSTIVERAEVERFIKALPSRGRLPDVTDGGDGR
jgi:hypothetical protein